MLHTARNIYQFISTVIVSFFILVMIIGSIHDKKKEKSLQEFRSTLKYDQPVKYIGDKIYLGRVTEERDYGVAFNTDDGKTFIVEHSFIYPVNY